MNRKILFCVLGVAAAPLYAADDTGRWYLTPQAGYLWTDDSRNTQDDLLYGLAFGKHLSDKWSAELNFNVADLDVPVGKFEFHALSADVLGAFASGRAVSPYVTFGAGMLKNSFSPGADVDDFMAQAGLGLMWRVSDHFALRPEVKARWDETGAQGWQTDYLAELGFQFTFAGAPAPQPAPVPAAPPPPAPAPPPPAPVQPVDSDGDGVLDPDDKCPGTPRGVAVDAQGCERKGSITLEGVMFEFNSATLLADSRAPLERVAEDLRKYPRLKIELQGHTDSVGSDEYNLDLSQQRAETVARFLIDAGVPASQMTTRGYGETDPIADNSTAEGRAQNRRVVMKVLENPGDVQVEGEGEL
jgi:OmpA-OmpF porin, OOP family